MLAPRVFLSQKKYVNAMLAAKFVVIKKKVINSILAARFSLVKKVFSSTRNFSLDQEKYCYLCCIYT